MWLRLLFQTECLSQPKKRTRVRARRFGTKLQPKQSFDIFMVLGLHLNSRWRGGVHCSAAQDVGGREAVGRPTLATSGALLYGLRS